MAGSCTGKRSVPAYRTRDDGQSGAQDGGKGAILCRDAKPGLPGGGK